MSKILYLLVFGICVAIGYLLGRSKRGKDKVAVQQTGGPEVEPALSQSITPELKPVTVLHGSINIDGILGSGAIEVQAENVVEAVNDFLTLAESRSREAGGKFERQGASFIILWGVEQSDIRDTERALLCATFLGKDLNQLNESRKIDGQKPLPFSMGLRSAQAIVGRIGHSGAMTLTGIGDVLDSAAVLNRIAAAACARIFVSYDVWEHCQNRCIGFARGEHKLTPNTGLVACYQLNGIKQENAPDVIVQDADAIEGDISAPGEQAPNRWLINNGCQILGPLGAREIATMLFSQEMDFDSECWVEGTGKSSTIRKAGIFSGSEDPGANLWVFDGETVHGPLSTGLLLTAFTRGAIAKGHVCEGSTIKGWKPIEEWVSSNSLSSQQSS
jgi:hypothetical protein